jgi:hypothetical protein
MKLTAIKRVILYSLIILIVILYISLSRSQNKNTEKGNLNNIKNQPGLTRETASKFASLALKCIQREYPNKPEHVLNNSDELKSPRSLHPVFYGCFDWHSSVHGHWMLIRILRLFPDLPESSGIRQALNENLSAENVLIEVKYLGEQNRKSFERTYGWAWLLKLADELYDWDDPDGKTWSKNLGPLVQVVVNRYMEFLPKQTYPIRTGVHPNTAFGISFALDYARKVGNTEFEKLLISRSSDYYGNDQKYSAVLEPGGEDFFSPALIEADLMRRVLAPKDFINWFKKFLPGLNKGEPKNLFQPAIVSDHSDPKIVHLDGLNLSRAWCMIGIASAMDDKNVLKKPLVEAADKHLMDALGYISSGSYEGEHWLASFAVYALSLGKTTSK